jgi:GWxTD domain-containing protein
VLALLAALPGRARGERMEGPPPWRAGVLVGFTLDAWAAPESTGHVLELAVRVPTATLERLDRDAAGDAHLRAEAVVQSAGSRAQRSEQRVTISAADTARGQGRVFVMRFAVAPGRCKVEVKLSGNLERKKGPADQPGPLESASVSGEVFVPRPQAGRELSEIEFLWPASSKVESPDFVRGGRVVVPNPDRLYGLLAGEMRARVVARGRPGDGPRPWHWVARVFDTKGQGVAQQESHADSAAGLDADVAIDVSNLAAAAYDLEVKAWQEGDSGALVRRGRFSVAWRADTWTRNADDVADEVHFLLPAGAEEEFVGMPLGERERVLNEFWAKRDPTPETAFNEAYDTFRQRVDHANRAFTQNRIEKGMFSDRGRVYIRYGEPSEITHQVMPAGSETLTQELQQILEGSDAGTSAHLRSPGLGGDMRPYEVWSYEGNIPLPLDADPTDPARGRTRRRILFIFVDDQSNGIYRLRYSTE